MIKNAIIGWILLVVMTFIIKCIAANLSVEEKIMIELTDIWPTRTYAGIAGRGPYNFRDGSYYRAD